VAKARIVDYNAVLAVPPNADLTGIQNAYARLSDEVARLIGEDDTIQEGILRLNEAYAVLSNPETRRKYDTVYFRGEKVQQKKRAEAAARRRKLAARSLVAVLGSIVSIEMVVLGFMAREDVHGAAASVLGPLFPGGAG
jgi:curved DNA-binding protein CbpA